MRRCSKRFWAWTCCGVRSVVEVGSSAWVGFLPGVIRLWERWGGRHEGPPVAEEARSAPGVGCTPWCRRAQRSAGWRSPVPML